MAPPQTEVADIWLQPTIHLSTPKGWKGELAWCRIVRADDMRWRPLAVQQSAVYPAGLAMWWWYRLPRQLRRTELHSRWRRQAHQVVGCVGECREAADTVCCQSVPLCDVARVYQWGMALWRWGWLHGLQRRGWLWVLCAACCYWPLTIVLQCYDTVGLVIWPIKQGDHLYGIPGNSEFDSCRGNFRDFTENQGIVREKILSGKSYPKLVYCKLHICVHTGI